MLHLRAERASYCLQELTSGWRALGWNAKVNRAVVHRHHATVGIGILHFVHRIHHQLFGSHAESDHKRHVSVIRIEPVMTGSEDFGGCYLNPLVPRATDLEVTLVLFVEGDCFLIE